MALIELLQLISVFLIPAVISYFVYKKLKFNKYVNLIIFIILFLILIVLLLFILNFAVFNSSSSTIVETITP